MKRSHYIHCPCMAILRTRHFSLLVWIALCTPRALIAHGDVHGQIVEISQQIEKNPTNTDLYIKRGELHRTHQDWDGAHADFDHAFALNPKLEVIAFAKGRLFLEAGWPLSAKVSLDRFLSKQSNHVEALVVRARTLAKLQRPVEAAADYTHAIAVTTESRPELYYERAQVLGAAGGEHSKEAVRGLDEGIRKLGPLVTLQLCALDIEVKEKQYDDALKRLDVVTTKSPRKETWLARRGEILQQAGRKTEAREAFNAALRAMETLPAARRNVPAMMDLQKHLREELDKLK
jgi:tetratricopeptide (TPR) repeat protein